MGATRTTRKRTRAREIAVQALYQYDALQRIGAATPAEDVDRFIDGEADDPEVRDFAREIVRGTRESIEDIDGILGAVVENWTLERIAAMDRAILRLSAYELNARPDIPPKVAINEAIELAKRYSTSQSGAFVNGVLDKLLKLKSADQHGGTEETRREKA
jgi:transcription antitermination factor NusB